ncbi:thioredoxin-dependent thiol peroxidase [Ignavibacteria bacterium]|jgi:peroxiredoxin Q/BCP|nr:thioredoxin-dependent thiol peroxidase [Bacteroidota bacterium]MCZ2132767.1 thioredoxin-dependent thiol peroxidase [Bacteroidota bacterium]
MSLNENSVAPDFTAANDNGNSASLADFRGKYIILYFYPKDNTTGCTAEACDFRDNMSVLTEYGAAVIGVSPDSAKSHNKFREKYALNFMLLSDEDKEICRLYGVWTEKSMYGRKYMGVERTTFLIDKQGLIRRIWRKVKVQGHIAEVLSFLQSIQNTDS